MRDRSYISQLFSDFHRSPIFGILHCTPRARYFCQPVIGQMKVTAVDFLKVADPRNHFKPAESSNNRLKSPRDKCHPFEEETPTWKWIHNCENRVQTFFRMGRNLTHWRLHLRGLAGKAILEWIATSIMTLKFGNDVPSLEMICLDNYNDLRLYSCYPIIADPLIANFTEWALSRLNWIKFHRKKFANGKGLILALRGFRSHSSSGT